MKEILNHTSIRKFKDKQVSDDLIREIIKTACRAPSTGNMQLYSVIVTKDENRLKQVKKLHFNQPAIIEAPLVLTFVADYYRFIRWCELRNAEPGYDNFLSFVTAAMDALLMAQNASILAESKGLGCCYLGTTLYNAEEFIELFSLPKFSIPIVTLSMGYPDENPEKSDKLPLDAIVHQEKYKDYSDEDIAAIYHYKENLPSSKMFIEENKKETLAQVYTDVRYKKEDNEHFSSKLIQTLKDQGFKF